MLKWLLAVLVLVALAAGAVAWYVTAGGGTLPWQAATAPSETDPPEIAPDQKPLPEGSGPGWALNCRSTAQDAGLSCRLSQQVVERGSGQVVTEATFFLPKDEQGDGQFSIRLPLGIMLPPGASIQVDANAPQHLRIRTCNPSGCYVEGVLSPAFLAQLRKGNALRVAFNRLNQDTVTVSLSLSGFEEAYAKAQKV